MRRTPIIDVVMASSVFLVSLGAYGLWYSVVSERSAQAASLTQNVQERGEVGGRAAQARQLLYETALDEAVAHRYFVSDKEVVSFLESLERAGEEVGASVSVVSVRADEENASSITVSFSVTGNFDAVLRTLGAVEYQPYDTHMTQLTLDTTEDTSAWTAAATIVVGSLPESTL